jgi:hypothetical protein
VVLRKIRQVLILIYGVIGTELKVVEAAMEAGIGTVHFPIES